MLLPHSPVLFDRARRILRDLARDAVDRFQVGALRDGCWTVTHGESGWRAVHVLDGVAVEASTHSTAREATARAVGDVLADAGTGVNSTVLQAAGLIVGKAGVWEFTDAGERPGAETTDAPRSSKTLHISLDDVAGRRGYLVCPMRPTSGAGRFVSVREVWSMAVFNELPEGPGEPGETLPEGKVLDGYGGPDQVFLFEPGTPFHRQGLPGDPTRHHPQHRYRVRAPLTVFPSFPFATDTISVENTAGQGRGYYLVDTVAALLTEGILAEVPGP
ncbi:glycohydrolase toxin TNT-related protein [Spirillospora albida]|uniref:glycohydrolase toxin TNT-related protein n=1 Tax=Spirillospora albida TaxID=58123 RepID=UPI0014702493|nr:glycohydrolase toxin TNT-related protein [Spirillospora albida]